jgi:integrase
MSLYRRGTIYWVKISVGGSKPVRESTGTTDRERAQEYHAARETELWRIHRLGERPRVALADAALDWLTNHSAHKRSHEADRLRMKAMLPYLPDGPLEDLTTSAMTRIRDRLRNERALPDRRSAEAQAAEPRPPRRLTAATVNRYLAILSAILNHAHKREWISAVPHIPYFKVEAHAVPMLTPDAVAALFRALPEHLRPMAVLALSTGLRQANVRDLRWDQVDFAARIVRVPPAAAKAGEAITVPLSDDAIAALRGQLGKHATHVFVWRGAPIAGKLTNTAWKRATKEAGLDGLRWHDLRHIWATWLAAAGVPEAIRQEWGGWKTAGMARRYTHLAGAHLVPFANAVRLPEMPPAAIVIPTLGTPKKARRPRHDSGHPPPANVSEGYAAEEGKTVGWLMGLEPTTTGITIRPLKRKVS